MGAKLRWRLVISFIFIRVRIIYAVTIAVKNHCVTFDTLAMCYSGSRSSCNNQQKQKLESRFTLHLMIGYFSKYDIWLHVKT